MSLVTSVATAESFLNRHLGRLLQLDGFGQTEGQPGSRMLGSPHSLVASLIWGSVGMGFFIYGKKQQSIVPMFGGLLVIGVSYFIESALYMSLAALALIAGIYWLKKQGY